MPSPLSFAAEINSEEQADSKPSTTMQFVLPSKYTMENIPKPNDPRVAVREVASRLMGVIAFNGNTMSAGAGAKLMEEHTSKLKTALSAAGYNIRGDFELARFNPPWTLGFLRTNEICYPVEKI